MFVKSMNDQLNYPFLKVCYLIIVYNYHKSKNKNISAYPKHNSCNSPPL